MVAEEVVKLPETAAEFYAAIDKLPPKQLDALSQVYMNNDAGHPRRTLEALEKKGLVVSKEQTLGGRFPVTIRRYDFPAIAAHAAWCQWVSDHPDAADAAEA